VISSSQKPQLSNTQYSQHTYAHAPAGFEPTIPGSERPQTHALDRAATGIGVHLSYLEEIAVLTGSLMSLEHTKLQIYFLHIPIKTTNTKPVTNTSGTTAAANAAVLNITTKYASELRASCLFLRNPKQTCPCGYLSNEGMHRFR